MDSPLDIYDRRMVDAMKRENAMLWRRWQEAVHENALLHERLDRYRRDRTGESECERYNLE